MEKVAKLEIPQFTNHLGIPQISSHKISKIPIESGEFKKIPIFFKNKIGI